MNNLFEIWKDIKGFENYEVSNLGNVRSKDRFVPHSKGGVKHNKSVLLKQCNRKGYKLVSLVCNGITYTKQVHRLVACAFLPNPNNLPQVNHKDENQSNNSVDNLEWCTAQYNLNYGTHNAKISQRQSEKNSNAKEVAQYSLDGEFLCKYKSITSASIQTNTSRTGIARCCNHSLQTTSGGYKWEWV